MEKPIHVAIIYNEPTIETDEGRVFATEIGVDHLNHNGWTSAAQKDGCRHHEDEQR